MPQEKNNRLTVIDDIRGVSIIVMILIHTNAYFLKNKIAFSLLEISQFAVVAFIFCSSYLFYQKNLSFTPASYLEYFKKRVYRLILPYYTFLIGYFLILLFQEPQKVTVAYLYKNMLLMGGIDFNWLVLLFIQLTLLMPFFSYLLKKSRMLLVIYTLIAVISSLIFLRYSPLPYFRWIMWLPWSLVVIYTMVFDRLKEDKKMFWMLTCLFFILFAVSQQLVLLPLHKSMRMYDNKYPPNIYHLAYSLFALNVLYFLSRMNAFSPVKNVVHFFSKYSYTIYFIHILVIYVLNVFMKIKFNWVGFFAVTITVTGLVQLGYNRLTASRR